MKTKPFLQVAVPGTVALLALAIALVANHETGGAHEVVVAPVNGPTPYSADHARAQRTAPDVEQPPTF